MVDEQDLHPLARTLGLLSRRSLLGRGAHGGEGSEQGAGLELGLALLGGGVGVEQQGRAGADGRHAVADLRGAQGEAGVHGPVEAEVADGAAVPAPGGRLVVLDELHRPGLGRPGDGDGPHVGEEGVEGVEPGAQAALDVVDGVDEAGVHLDLAAADDLDGAGDADARLVVAVDVGAHGQLGLLLHRAEQRADGLGVLHGVGAAGDGAGDRAGLDPVALDADVHLGGGADQVLALAEVEEELVRGGVDLAQAPVEAGGVVAGGVEDLSGNHLEQVAAPELRLGGLDDLGVLPRLGIFRDLGGGGGKRDGLAGTREAAGRHAVDGELVEVLPAGLALAVDHHDPVGQVEDQVALAVRAVERLPDRLELEGQVVAERPVQPEVLVVAGEGGDHLADRGEDRGTAAAHLLGQDVL